MDRGRELGWGQNASTGRRAALWRHGAEGANACDGHVPVGRRDRRFERFSGALSGAPADALLAVLHIAPSGAVSTDDVITGAGGAFTDVFTPNQPGAWKAEAHYNGDANHAPAAAICRFTVARPSSTLSLQCTPDPNKRFISCTGGLTSEGAGLGQTPIKLSYESPSGSPAAHTATTAQDGTFSDRLNAPAGSLLTSGMWTIQAQYR